MEARLGGIMEVIKYEPFTGSARLYMKLYDWDTRVQPFSELISFTNGGFDIHTGPANVALASADDLLKLNSILNDQELRIEGKDGFGSKTQGVFIDDVVRQQIPGQNKPRIISLSSTRTEYSIHLDRLSSLKINTMSDYDKLDTSFQDIEMGKEYLAHDVFLLGSAYLTLARQIRKRGAISSLYVGLQDLYGRCSMEPQMKNELSNWIGEQRLVMEQLGIQYKSMRALQLALGAALAASIILFWGLGLNIIPKAAFENGQLAERKKWEAAADNTGPYGGVYFVPVRDSLRFIPGPKAVEPGDSTKPYILIPAEFMPSDIREISSDSLLKKDTQPSPRHPGAE